MTRIHASLRSLAPFALLAALAAFGAGCANGNYGSAAVTQQTGDPAAILNFQTGLSIPVGSVASADVQLLAVDGDDLAGNLESEDPSVLVIAGSAGTPNGYVFEGVAPGQTHVLVLVNGAQVATVSATVLGPSSSDVAYVAPDAGTTGADGVVDASVVADAKDATSKRD